MEKFKSGMRQEEDRLENENSRVQEDVERRKKKTSYVFAINDADEALDRLQQKKSGRF